MNNIDIHYQLKILVFIFCIVLASIILGHETNANDIVMTAFIGMGNTVLGYIGALIVNKERTVQQRTTDGKDMHIEETNKKEHLG